MQIATCTSSITRLACALLVLSFTATANAQSALTKIQNTVNDIQAKVNRIRTDAKSSADAIRSGLSQFTSDMRTEINSAIDEARQELDEVRMERASFLADAGQFRADFADILLMLEGISDEISLISGMRFSLELDRERALVLSLPDRAVAPFYRAVAANGRLNVAALKAGLSDARRSLAVTRSVIPSGCTATLEQRDAVEDAASDIMHSAIAVTMVAKALDAKGERGVTSKPIQIHGYVGLQVKNNRVKQLGAVMEGLGDVLMQVNTFVLNKLRFCVLEDGQSRILTQLSTLNLDLSNMDMPVSTRASQASVDTLALAVGQRMDAAISTRASQASVDTLLEHIGAPTTGPSVLVRIEVERQLSSRSKPVAIFFLPKPLGGILDVVRQVVEDTIKYGQVAGFRVDKAIKELSAGDEASALGDYWTAYLRYAKAYRRALAID